MPEGVTYTKEAEAAAYAESVGGTVVPVDTDGDGVIDGYNVIMPQYPGADEGVTSGPTFVPEGSSAGARGATRSPTIVPEGSSTSESRNMGDVVKDELGYMHGGLGFTHRDPIKYSKGGAVKGKTFRGSY